MHPETEVAANEAAPRAAPWFTRFPPEIRIHIWDLTVEPRTATVDDYNICPRAWDDYAECGRPPCGCAGLYAAFCVRSSPPIPAGLHVCHESRAALQKHYVRGFTQDLEPHYVWVNFEMDIIDVHSDALGVITSWERRITQLRLTTHCNPDFHQSQLPSLRVLFNLKRLFIDSMSRTTTWATRAGRREFWPCAFEHVFILSDAGTFRLYDLVAPEDDADDADDTDDDGYLPLTPDFEPWDKWLSN